MDDDQDEQEQSQERPRPRVVDKRVSARPPTGASEPPAPAQPGPSTTEPTGADVRAAEEDRRGPGRPDAAPAPPPPSDQAEPGTPEATELGAEAPGVWTPEQEEQARRIAEEIARTPAIDLIITFVMNFVEIASVKLQVGDLAGAQLAIDAFEGVVKSLGPKLGEAESPLRSYLAQLQMAYAQRAAPPSPGPRPS